MRVFRFAKISVKGLVPERMLSKIRRLGIPLYGVKKTASDTICFFVLKRDEGRVRALENSAYKISTLRKIDFFKELKKRISLLIGGILFLTVTCLSNSFIFAIDVIGADGYEREVYEILKDNGVRAFAPYKQNVERLSAQILRLDGVAFCSVKKLGTSLRIEILKTSFEKVKVEKGDMRSSFSGTLLSLTVLSGSPLKKVGDSVQAGDLLVGGYLTTDDGEIVQTKVVAVAEILVCYQAVIECENPAVAYAKACFEWFGKIPAARELQEKTVEKREDGYLVKINYTAVQSMNF